MLLPLQIQNKLLDQSFPKNSKIAAGGWMSRGLPNEDTVVTVGLLKQLLGPTREYCYSKIHRCVVTEARLDYVGSITVDAALLRAAGILPHTKIEVVNLSRMDAARIMTYVIEGPEGSGVICLNGAAAYHFTRGDLAILMAYQNLPVSQIPHSIHRVVQVNGEAGIVEGHTNEIVAIQEFVTPALDELGRAENNRYAQVYSETPVKSKC
jgi:aspartate 1-decarboxylase